MAKNPVTPVGSKDEIKAFEEANSHYTMAREDLEHRIQMKDGFNDVDKLIASHIDESKWPYRSVVFDPIPHTVILEKSARLIGNKPRGRMVPREGGDTLGAYINNELLSFQWDDNSRLGESMISKWIKMDQGSRKYRKKFGICLWRYETRIIDGKRKVFYDGPDFKVCKSRDSLPNPSYETVQKWFQYREYFTLDDLEKTNDAARTEPVYKNLDKLREVLRNERKGKGDLRETTSLSKNKSMRGLTDYLGQDEVFKTVEIVTEYRPDRWITFAPRHGVVIRDIPNPYRHQEIPVVELGYYPLEDDLYGENELEAVTKLVRSKNAHLSAYSDEIAIRLRPPIMVNPTSVRMHTLEYVPEAKWLMNEPGKDVQQMNFEAAVSANFNSINNIMTGMALNALGESSQGISSINPQQDTGRVTATEVKDTAFTRNVRDNMNQIFLSEALKRQMMLWHSMNQQFMFQGSAEKAKIIRIVGRDAVEFFNRTGLSTVHPTQEEVLGVANGTMDQTMVGQGPEFAVDIDGAEVPKFQPDPNGEGGNLILEPGDLVGMYDYQPDVESMRAPSQEMVENKLTAILATITNPTVLQLLQAERKRPKVSELLVKMFEATNVIKDAEAYFEDLPQPQIQPNDQTNTGGIQAPTTGPVGQGNGGVPGMEGSPSPVAPGQNPQLMGGPQIL
jgi:hypothetical protein